MGCIHSKPDVLDSPFAAAVRRQTSSVISTVAVDAANFHSLSFNSLRAAADVLLGVNRDALDNILELKDEIADNPDLLHFVEHYLASSIDTLRFFAALRDSLRRAREVELIVDDAIQLFDAADYSSTLEKLQEFKAEGHPFTEHFVERLKGMGQHQRSVFQELQQKKQEIDKKLRSVKAWRKVWNIIYSAAFAAVLICSVLLAAVAAPPAATAAAAAASGAMVPIQQWVDSMWDKYQGSIEEDKEAMTMIKRGAFFAIHELDSIRVIVERVEMDIREIVRNSEFAGGDGEEEAAVKVAMGEIRRKLGDLGTNLEKLEKEVEECRSNLEKATTTILQSVTNRD